MFNVVLGFVSGFVVGILVCVCIRYVDKVFKTVHIVDASVYPNEKENVECNAANEELKQNETAEVQSLCEWNTQEQDLLDMLEESRAREKLWHDKVVRSYARERQLHVELETATTRLLRIQAVIADV